jgi:hypothetical protein
MFSIAGIIAAITNNRIVQGLVAFFLLVIGLMAYGAKKKREGREKAKAEMKKALDQAERDTERRIDEADGNDGDINFALERLRKRNKR